MSGVDAYRRTLNQTESSRDTEFRLLAQVTSALIHAQKIADEIRSNPEKMAQYSTALNWNNQVWDMFADDCGAEGNQLPKDLRGAIVSLGIWVKKETQAVLNNEGDLGSLIAVNRDIMKGLQNSAALQKASEQGEVTEGKPGIPPNGLFSDTA